MTRSLRAALPVLLSVAGVACHSGGGNNNRIVGQTSFVSAPPAGQVSSVRGPVGASASGAGAASGADTAAATASPPGPSRRPTFIGWRAIVSIT